MRTTKRSPEGATLVTQACGWVFNSDSLFPVFKTIVESNIVSWIRSQ